MATDTHNEIAEAYAQGFTYDDLLKYAEIGDRNTHWRLCYHRAGRNWRLKDERTGRLWLVNQYKGDAQSNCKDGGSHVFSDGYARVDEEGTAWLSEEPFDG